MMALPPADAPPATSPAARNMSASFQRPPGPRTQRLSPNSHADDSDGSRASPHRPSNEQSAAANTADLVFQRRCEKAITARLTQHMIEKGQAFSNSIMFVPSFGISLHVIATRMETFKIVLQAEEVLELGSCAMHRVGYFQGGRATFTCGVERLRSIFKEGAQKVELQFGDCTQEPMAKDEGQEGLQDKVLGDNLIEVVPGLAHEDKAFSLACGHHLLKLIRDHEYHILWAFIGRSSALDQEQLFGTVFDDAAQYDAIIMEKPEYLDGSDACMLAHYCLGKMFITAAPEVLRIYFGGGKIPKVSFYTSRGDDSVAKTTTPPALDAHQPSTDTVVKAQESRSKPPQDSDRLRAMEVAAERTILAHATKSGVPIVHAVIVTSEVVNRLTVVVYNTEAELDKAIASPPYRPPINGLPTIGSIRMGYLRRGKVTLACNVEFLAEFLSSDHKTMNLEIHDLAMQQKLRDWAQGTKPRVAIATREKDTSQEKAFKKACSTTFRKHILQASLATGIPIPQAIIGGIDCTSPGREDIRVAVVSRQYLLDAQRAPQEVQVKNMVMRTFGFSCADRVVFTCPASWLRQFFSADGETLLGRPSLVAHSSMLSGSEAPKDVAVPLSRSGVATAVAKDRVTESPVAHSGVGSRSSVQDQSKPINSVNLGGNAPAELKTMAGSSGLSGLGKEDDLASRAGGTSGSDNFWEKKARDLIEDMNLPDVVASEGPPTPETEVAVKTGKDVEVNSPMEVKDESVSSADRSCDLTGLSQPHSALQGKLESGASTAFKTPTPTEPSVEPFNSVPLASDFEGTAQAPLTDSPKTPTPRDLLIPSNVEAMPKNKVLDEATAESSTMQRAHSHQEIKQHPDIDTHDLPTTPSRSSASPESDNTTPICPTIHDLTNAITNALPMTAFLLVSHGDYSPADLQFGLRLAHDSLLQSLNTCDALREQVEMGFIVEETQNHASGIGERVDGRAESRKALCNLPAPTAGRKIMHLVEKKAYIESEIVGFRAEIVEARAREVQADDEAAAALRKRVEEIEMQCLKREEVLMQGVEAVMTVGVVGVLAALYWACRGS